MVDKTQEQGRLIDLIYKDFSSFRTPTNLQPSSVTQRCYCSDAITSLYSSSTQQQTPIHAQSTYIQLHFPIKTRQNDMQVSNTRTLTLKRSYTSCAHTRCSKQSSHHQFSSPHSTRKRPRHETTSMTPQVHEP